MTTVISQRIAPGLIDYATDCFHLGTELKQLAAVRAVDATEAIILYCARTLEAITNDAVAKLGLNDGGVFINIGILDALGVLPRYALYFSHGLRRLGNDVRHIRRLVEPGESNLALSFLEPYLRWFFCEFAAGPRQPALTEDGNSLFPGTVQDVAALLIATESAEPDALRSVWGTLREKSPTLMALLAEALLDSMEFELAGEVLETGLDQEPGNPRLTQLQALLFSRTGYPSKAVELLMPLRKRSRDIETIGILGGAYKRLGLAADDPKNYLELSHKEYDYGWRRTEEVYLGINVASTAIWLGHKERGLETASRVRELLLERLKTVRGTTREKDRQLDFWSQVTLAEAELIVGNLEESKASYHNAFERHPEKPTAIEVARSQARHTAIALGMEGFL